MQSRIFNPTEIYERFWYIISRIPLLQNKYIISRTTLQVETGLKNNHGTLQTLIKYLTS